ncbi:MAG: iron-sulfur cluster repair di-iron protein [Acidobacteria bacterium]|nr:iron-sulfur cluster repair di-iron protein [Acidobacteriota bacterium]
MKINVASTVGDLAVVIPGATRVFEKFGIDYCCGGKRTLDEACRSSNLAFDDVLHQLELSEQNAVRDQSGPDWSVESLTDFARYIVDKHHVFTRDELDRIEKLLTRVCGVHGARHPELIQAQSLFFKLKSDLIPHMLKEEQVLFPYVERMEEAIANNMPVPQPFFGTVGNPVRMMMMEHDTVGELLRELRKATNDYSIPDDACISYQSLYQAMTEFEADIHQHIHLENNIFFPRALEMESKNAPEIELAGKEFGCKGHPSQ